MSETQRQMTWQELCDEMVRQRKRAEVAEQRVAERETCLRECRDKFIGKRALPGYICLACNAYTDENNRNTVKHNPGCLFIRADELLATKEAKP